MKPTIKIRKDNLLKIILDKFQGNNSAFSRAVEIHPNHVNLLVTVNPNTQRNMGEALARRIETAMGLPLGWMDAPHGAAANFFVIKAVPVDLVASRALISCRDYSMIEVTSRWETRVSSKVTAMENLSVATVVTAEMEPIITNGATVVVDLGVKGVGADGIYVLSKGDAAFIRSVRRNMDGTHSIEAANPIYRSEKPEQLNGMKVVARVIMQISEELL
ncbi:MAG: S24 family peptidase [Rhodoferax sp.]|uniref:S24 family peptidase n=1 Tax=Rhodoferax sp. TaxID=50421 RepID=UPI00301B19E8